MKVASSFIGAVVASLAGEERKERETGDRERISRSATEGERDVRCVRKGSYMFVVLAVWRSVVKGLVLLVDVGSSFEIRERGPSGGFGVSMARGLERVGFGFSSEGRKKGAFSGALAASFGLLRSAMVSRWRSVCQRLRGTRERVVICALSWSVLGARTEEESISGVSSSKAEAMRP